MTYLKVGFYLSMLLNPVGEGNILKKEFKEISDIITRFLLFPSTHLYKIS